MGGDGRETTFDQPRKLRALPLEELAETADDSEISDRITAKELGRAINDFLLTLPERDRRMFVLRYVTAEEPESIAGKLGITTNSLSVRLHRIRAKLRAYLKERGYIER